MPTCRSSQHGRADGGVIFFHTKNIYRRGSHEPTGCQGDADEQQVPVVVEDQRRHVATDEFGLLRDAQFCEIVADIEELVADVLLEPFLRRFVTFLLQLLPLDLMADKKAQNLLDGIDRSRKSELPRVIYSLGIIGVGASAAVGQGECLGPARSVTVPYLGRRA